MITLYFGSPGCGKTTLSQYLMLRSKSLYRISNFENKLSDYVPSSFIGKVAFPDYSTLYIDEAGIDYNNRKYKDMSQDTIEYFKLHRHFKNDIVLFSQSWEDVDITLRRLTDVIWYCKRIGPFTMCRKVRKFVTVDKNTNQIIDGYRFSGLIWSLLPPPFHEKTIFFVFRPLYYKYFDSFSKPSKFIKFSNPLKKRCQENVLYKIFHYFKYKRFLKNE